MIAFLDGSIDYLDPTHVIINVGGVGYEVKISLNTFSTLKDHKKAKVLTYLHVREDAQILYGFMTGAEKQRFLDLISISGVGPGTALTVLSSLTADDLQAAILQGDVRTIQQVKGIGAKTAQRIILELKDKMAKGSSEIIPGLVGISSQHAIREEALAALVTLGINRGVAEKSIQKVLKNSDKVLSLEEIIKLALKTD